MGRLGRPDLPGGIFHLTARAVRRQRLFTPALRTAAVDIIVDAFPASRARLLALTIMPNHLHLVVQQGGYRLDRLMQPILRRLAHLMHRRHEMEGPVFWRPYGCQPCLAPEHARNAIAYAHLNPVRAGMCADPARYPWSSHALYTAVPPTPGHTAAMVAGRMGEVLNPRDALPLFAATLDRPMTNLRQDYEAFVAWRLELDRWKTADLVMASTLPPPPPPLAWPEFRERAPLSPLFHVPASGRKSRKRPAGCPDLADIAKTAVACESPGLHYQAIRGRCGGPHYSRIRRLVIERAHAAGYSNAEIARFLDLSPSAISKVIRAGSSG